MEERAAVGRSRRHQIADLLRQEILSGRLRPNVWVRLQDLAERFGVSVTPIREAVQVLADESLVEVQTRKGVRAVGVSATDVEDLFTLYGLVSGVMSERAVALLTEEDIGRLDNLIARMDETIDSAALEELNWQFHRIIHRPVRSRYLVNVARMLAKNIPQTYFGLIPDWGDSANKGHRAILQAIRNRDAAAARLLAAEHVKKGGDLLIKYLFDTGYWGPLEA
jgi:DNA-binding GntR family transcriptional regulator